MHWPGSSPPKVNLSTSNPIKNKANKDADLMLLRNRRQISSQDHFISNLKVNQEHTRLNGLTAENNDVFGQRCCPETWRLAMTDIISQRRWAVPGRKLQQYKEVTGCGAKCPNTFTTSRSPYTSTRSLSPQTFKISTQYPNSTAEPHSRVSWKTKAAANSFKGAVSDFGDDDEWMKNEFKNTNKKQLVP